MDYANWKYLPAGYSRTMVFFPGWATDARVLQREKLQWNLIVPQQPYISPSVLGTLAIEIENNDLDKVTVASWSMGGILAHDFAERYPQYVDKLILASMRSEYPADQIEIMREQVTNEKEATLRSFYRQIFYPRQMADYRTFRAELEADYLRDFAIVDLLKGLVVLSKYWSRLFNASCPISFIHGSEDIIAPVSEAISLAAEKGADFTLIDQATHALPWCDDFYKIINEK